jgi:hypothetical protein
MAIDFDLVLEKIIQTQNRVPTGDGYLSVFSKRRPIVADCPVKPYQLGICLSDQKRVKSAAKSRRPLEKFIPAQRPGCVVKEKGPGTNL